MRIKKRTYQEGHRQQPASVLRSLKKDGKLSTLRKFNELKLFKFRNGSWNGTQTSLDDFRQAH